MKYIQLIFFFNEIKYYNEFKKILTKLETCINDEGGLIEYNSYDPGYQTRSLKYLTKTLKLLKGNDFDRCLELCNNSLKFLNKVFMPDGTLYSMFGSRNTELIYPSGIEYMNYKRAIHDMLSRRFLTKQFLGFFPIMKAHVEKKGKAICERLDNLAKSKINGTSARVSVYNMSISNFDYIDVLDKMNVILASV